MSTIAAAAGYFIMGADGTNRQSVAAAAGYVVGGTQAEKLSISAVSTYSVIGPYPQPTEEPQTFIGA